MKNRFNFLSVAILFIVLSITSCGTQKEGEKVVDEFIVSYNLKDFEKIKQLTKSDIADLMKKFVESHYEKYGEIESYDKYKTNIFTNNQNTGVDLSYKCKYSKSDETIYIKFTVIEDGDEHKIVSFNFSQNKENIDSLESNYKKAKDVGLLYYNHLKKDKLDEITSLLDNKRIIEAGNKEAFFNFIKDRQEYYGEIKSYTIHNYTNTVTDDLPTFIIIYDCITNKGSLVEEISFIKEGDNFKIFNYRYAGTYDELINQ